MSEGEVPSIASPSRRLVKAKTPPPSALVVEVRTSTTPEDDSLEDSSGVIVGYPLASPSVEREMEQERSVKWRKERLDATVAKQKQQRGKDLMGRRQSGTVQMTAIEARGMMETPPAAIPPEFSVEPQYPEHKRSGDDLVSLSGGPLGKRRKASIDEDKPEKDRSGRATNVMFVTAALAAAVAIGVAVLRRFGRG